MLDPEFRMLCEIFTERTGCNVPYYKYVDDTKKDVNVESLFSDDDRVTPMCSLHYGLNPNGKKNGLIYCGRTFVPNNCIVYLKCGYLSGLPCEDCREILKKKGGPIDSKNYNGSKYDYSVQTLFDMCKNEVENVKDAKQSQSISKSGQGGNATKKTELNSVLKKLLVGGVQCDVCKIRYYSFYMPFVCSCKNDKRILASICFRCYLNFKDKKLDGVEVVEIPESKDIKKVDKKSVYKITESYKRAKYKDVDEYLMSYPNKYTVRNIKMMYGVLDDLKKIMNSEDDIFDRLYNSMIGNLECANFSAHFKGLKKEKEKDIFSEKMESQSAEALLKDKDVGLEAIYYYHVNKKKLKKKDYDQSSILKEFKDYALIIQTFRKFIFEGHDYTDVFSDITFNLIDEDKSGIIGLNEYRKYAKMLMENKYSSHRADLEFKTFDTDNSNAIDMMEFREIFKVSIWGFEEAESAFVFRLIDTDHDGWISLDEFLAYFEKTQPSVNKACLNRDFEKHSINRGSFSALLMDYEQFKEFYVDALQKSAKKSNNNNNNNATTNDNNNNAPNNQLIASANDGNTYNGLTVSTNDGGDSGSNDCSGVPPTSVDDPSNLATTSGPKDNDDDDDGKDERTATKKKRKKVKTIK